jgi:hypothetical protein
MSVNEKAWFVRDLKRVLPEGVNLLAASIDLDRRQLDFQLGNITEDQCHPDFAGQIRVLFGATCAEFSPHGGSHRRFYLRVSNFALPTSADQS